MIEFSKKEIMIRNIIDKIEAILQAGTTPTNETISIKIEWEKGGPAKITSEFKCHITHVDIID